MLHPDIADFIDLAQRSPGTAAAPFHTLTPDAARGRFEATTQQLRWEAPQSVDCADLPLPLRDGQSTTLRLYRPPGSAGQSLGVVVFVHGGGYVVGSLDSHDGICRELCAGASCAVLAVGYRLAPEQRFPTALEDCIDALGWLAAHADTYGLDLQRVAFAGDSVGASLATVLATLAARDPAVVSGIVPRLQLLCYPMTDASQRSTSMELFAEDYLLESETLAWFYRHYARTPEDYADWRFSPLLTEDLAGVAPAFIALAGFDPLLDEGRAYADRLLAHGIAVQVKEYGALTHDFLRMSRITSDVTPIYRTLCQAVREALG